MPLRARMACTRRRAAKGLPEVQIAPVGQAKTAAESIPLNPAPQHRYIY
jgi:hypothetical protein